MTTSLLQPQRAQNLKPSHTALRWSTQGLLDEVNRFIWPFGFLVERDQHFCQGINYVTLLKIFPELFLYSSKELKISGRRSFTVYVCLFMCWQISKNQKLRIIPSCFRWIGRPCLLVFGGSVLNKLPSWKLPSWRVVRSRPSVPSLLICRTSNSSSNFKFQISFKLLQTPFKFTSITGKWHLKVVGDSQKWVSQNFQLFPPGVAVLRFTGFA